MSGGDYREGNAWTYVRNMAQGSAEHVYALDYLRWRLAIREAVEGPWPDRPDLAAYGLGSRVGEFLREQIDLALGRDS